MNRQLLTEQRKEIEQMETHRSNQERLHSLGQQHDQSICRHCTGEQPSALKPKPKDGVSYTYTKPSKQENARAMRPGGAMGYTEQISPEARKNHERMLSLLRELAVTDRSKRQTLLKSWYDNSTDPLAQNLLHKMGLQHHSQYCPSCQRGERMEGKRLFREQ